MRQTTLTLSAVVDYAGHPTRGHGAGGSLHERLRGYHPAATRGCHRLLRHRHIKALIVKIRKAQAAGDVFGVYMLRIRLERELAA